ncbi:MAG: class D beta-lactamase [Xanthomonadales bacterium]|nr:class D beta-lactamase [Xanthomonadales bacterium]
MKTNKADKDTAILIMKKLLASLLFLFVSQVFALDVEQNPEIEKLFDEAGVKGCFVLYDLNADRLIVHDLLRAEKRFIPASTFKIANSLIGLSTGAVSSVDEVLPYGGKPQPFKFWEQDMGLRDAIRVSNVPVYQELARRIGLDRMRENLAAIPYGNTETGVEVDTFWLKGPLKISALEQTRFLARLAQGSLPFPAETQQSVREILHLEQDDDWVLYGKTGWTTTPDPDIGWWVGWVVKDGHVFSFALNIDMPERVDVAKRMELGKAALKSLGIL